LLRTMSSFLKSLQCWSCSVRISIPRSEELNAWKTQSRPRTTHLQSSSLRLSSRRFSACRCQWAGFDLPVFATKNRKYHQEVWLSKESNVRTRFATKTDAEWERTYSNGSVNTAFSTRSQSEPKNSLVSSQRSEVR
jgi:hypothetical protein